MPADGRCTAVSTDGRILFGDEFATEQRTDSAENQKAAPIRISKSILCAESNRYVRQITVAQASALEKNRGGSPICALTGCLLGHPMLALPYRNRLCVLCLAYRTQQSIDFSEPK
jgi:hypothetical protein